MRTLEEDARPSVTWCSKRQSPRLEVMGSVQGQLVADQATLTILDLGLGGFGVESSAPFEVGKTYRFKFTTSKGSETVLEASARHCRWIEAPTGSGVYRAGFAFVSNPEGEASRAVDLLLEAAASIIVFQ